MKIPGKCVRCGKDTGRDDTLVCDPCLDADLGPAPLVEKAAVKSGSDVTTYVSAPGGQTHF
jgi:hypothetical protein